jgi:beta-glucosidase-like glycosyl hydrolase
MNPARVVFPALRWRPESAFRHEDDAIRAGLDAGVAGFIIFGVAGARADEVASLTSDLRRSARLPLLLGADLERGAGQQARRLTAIPPPRALASLKDPSVITWAGRTTGREARALGLDWVFAPCADLDLEPDNPIVQTRSFGSDPQMVGAQVTAWVRACQEAGALACVKHFPGHGRTRVDSHQTLPRVDATREQLQVTDLLPFRLAVEAGVAGVMTAHVAFPDWDPGGAPATRSRVILDYLKGTLGFGGVVLTDALIMEGAAGSTDPAVVAAMRAGCDALLYPGDLAVTLAALEAATQDSGFRSRLADAIARLERVRERIPAAVPGLPDAGDPFAASLADRLLAGGMLRGARPSFGSGLHFAIVDDDLGGWYPPGPNDLVPRILAAHRSYEQVDGALVVLAFAEPRAAKGRAGFSAGSLDQLARLGEEAALLVLFGHPRLAEQLPGSAPILCAWHRQPLMQEAVARWLAVKA